MHELFLNHLGEYAMKKDVAKVPLLYQLENTHEQLTKGDTENESQVKEQLTAVEKKIEAIEETHYVLKQMPKESFDRFYVKYISEKKNIIGQLEQLSGQISNP